MLFSSGIPESIYLQYPNENVKMQTSKFYLEKIYAILYSFVFFPTKLSDKLSPYYLINPLVSNTSKDKL